MKPNKKLRQMDNSKIAKTTSDDFISQKYPFKDDLFWPNATNCLQYPSIEIQENTFMNCPKKSKN